LRGLKEPPPGCEYLCNPFSRIFAGREDFANRKFKEHEDLRRIVLDLKRRLESAQRDPSWALPLCLGILIAGPSLRAQTVQGQSGNEGELTRLAEGVYADIVSPDGNAVGNSGVVILEHSVLVFDTHFTPEAGQALLTKIRALTTKPVRYVVNSHYHPDHTHGNQVFAGPVQFLGSTNARRDILQKDLPAFNRTLSAAQAQLAVMRKELTAPEADAAAKEQLRRQIAMRQELLDRVSRLKITPPILALDDSLTLTEGKREVELRYIGIGHTDGDIVLYLPAEKVLFLGDLFFNSALPNTQDASLLEWMKTLEHLLRIDAERWVPGHGPVGTKKEVGDFLSYLQELKSLVEPAVTRGDSVEQTLRDVQIPARFSSYSFQNFFPANVQQMYVELRAIQLATSSSSPAEGKKKDEPEKPSP
jgi:glyoxylase-like metal-dependent hydrolase (beta-lactamase superfamily II)